MGRGAHLTSKLLSHIQKLGEGFLNELEAVDPMPKEDGRALWAWYKRANRASLKRRGYIRMDIQMSPLLYKKLKPYLQEYCLHQYDPRGSELVRFLEDLEITK